MGSRIEAVCASARGAGRRWSGALLAALVVLPSLGWCATPELTSVRVDRPAFFEREGQTVTLLSRMGLGSGDRVLTQANGKAELRFVSALSLVLGEHSRFEIHSREAARPGRAPVLRARLLSGRLRVQPLAKGQPPGGDLRLNVGALRLRWIDGELLAETLNGADLACAPEGSFDAHLPGSSSPLRVTGACLRRDPEGQVSHPALPEKAQPILAATRFSAPANPPLPSTGWTVVIATLADESSARAEAEGLVGEGLPARVLPSRAATGALYRVAIGGFERQSQAKAYAESIRESHGVFEGFVSSY